MNRISPRVPLSLAAAALAVIAAGGCGGKHEAKQTHAGETATVRVFRAGGSAGGEIVLPGRVRAREEVTLTATMPGRVTALPVAEGRAFARGDALVRFGAPEAESALAAARAGLAAASSRLADAMRQEARMDSLFSIRVASRREQEMAQTEARAARAAEEQARAQLAALETGTRVPAPFAGVMVRHHVDVGAGVNPGQPLVDVRSSGAIEIEVAVPESEAARTRQGAFSFQVGAGPWQAAKLARVEGMTDYATRTRIAYLAPASATGLDPGAFVRVRLGAAGAAAAAGTEGVAGGPVMVPARSLVRRGALTGAFVVREDRAALRWLSLGREAGGEVEVLAGLWPGEDIVLDPAGLEDGQPVKVER